MGRCRREPVIEWPVTLTVEAIETLGARRLAEILLSHAEMDERLAQTLCDDPQRAAELLGRFIRLDRNLMERADDADGVFAERHCPISSSWKLKNGAGLAWRKRR